MLSEIHIQMTNKPSKCDRLKKKIKSSVNKKKKINQILSKECPSIEAQTL